MCFAAGSSTAFADNDRGRPDRRLDARWQLNPAGQLELLFDPLRNGYSIHRETHTVVLHDRSPKLCGDPDGTGRYIWFFTDALMIEKETVPQKEIPSNQHLQKGEKERP
ncbi:MAG: hypothetical protein GWM98_29895 [Nitrospinaceae bacterium]|nr:hypothetical protein [Nitrospinaceae bacterium]NIR57909.1 hypothetical protein [Nitrospinaceae bacterium]NIS88367.1 hypothetical protein [Nitrospinaceae bacterium]NIT85245.1 hypothetical protein [Nitrospinaceae bacterium]NIU47398.1 hypothetical protein [Nitrospinaceae bacterium]